MGQGKVKSKKSSGFFSAQSFVDGFTNNALGVVGFVAEGIKEEVLSTHQPPRRSRLSLSPPPAPQLCAALVPRRTLAALCCDSGRREVCAAHEMVKATAAGRLFPQALPHRSVRADLS